MTMAHANVLSGVLLEEDALTVEELARACAVSPEWIVERVEAGLLGHVSVTTGEIRFVSAHLVRARRLAFAERGFECNQEVAALVADLIEEVERLRRELQAARSKAGRLER
jgi:chaperone modulatory protein CbpM